MQRTELVEGSMASLIESIRDWQFQHGSLIKVPPRSGMTSAYPIGVAVFPSRIEKRLFEKAVNLQCTFNRMYAAVSTNEEWLQDALHNLLDNNTMAKMLWGIHGAVKEEGYVQDISLGIFRSDYMLHVGSSGLEEPSLKQVEFNTFSVAGGVHSNKVTNVHKYLAASGGYGAAGKESLTSIPPNDTTHLIATALAEAHSTYGTAKSDKTRITGVLFVVQSNNVNICDERPIEYELWSRGVPAFRIEFGDATLAATSLSPSKELLFYPSSTDAAETVEVSVVYHRAGYDPEEYDEVGCEVRYQLELSRAIKCPSILGHLAGLKVVQQKLAEADSVPKFLPPARIKEVEDTFMRMFPLDESALGMQGRNLATDAESARDFVLKPSLEGGGHNIFHQRIPEFLASIPQSTWQEYILMEKIEPPHVNNVLNSSNGVYSGRVVSELGIFGSCLWRQSASGPEMLHNRQIGFSLKTKKSSENEYVIPILRY